MSSKTYLQPIIQTILNKHPMERYAIQACLVLVSASYIDNVLFKVLSQHPLPEECTDDMIPKFINIFSTHILHLNSNIRERIEHIYSTLSTAEKEQAWMHIRKLQAFVLHEEDE